MEADTESKWNQFEHSGSIADYLAYRGIKAIPHKACVRITA